METDDPRAALTEKRVALRAAACRDLGREGTWDDIARLVEVGWGDPSVAVRLHAAAAAADWLARRRGAHGQETLSLEARTQAMRWALAKDPGTNPSMLMLTAVGPTDDVLLRLGRIVRDPRGDVRLGVVTAVRRLVLSAVGDTDAVARAVGDWLADERLPPDTRSDLVKVVGEAGLSSLRPVLLSLRKLDGDLARLADTALDRLDARTRPATWAGPWISDGRDVFEDAPVRGDELLLVGPDAAVDADGTRPLVLDGAQARLGDAPARLVWATPLGGVEPRLVLQAGGRTWWRPDPPTAVARLEQEAFVLRGWGAAAGAALAAWAPTLSPLVGERTSALAAWLSGDLEGASARLDALVDGKKPAPDLLLWRAHVRAGLGRTKEAAADARAFLDKAPKGSALRPLAEALAG